ncbi:MAG TPA: glycerophosphodiester phosphodiesterase [Candidatus Saccharibacteria bacterium]|nr:glycerophosphodiester phosphodiesterase [Candidatus Saccharibacteria bacterium]
MQIIGHRGARGLAPENTVKAILRGLANNVDMIEIDVRMQGTKVVLSHDLTVPDHVYTTLREALLAIKGRCPINIEIKELQVVDYLPNIIDKYKGELLFSSFEFKILQAVKKRFPDIPIAILEKWSGVRAVAEASLLGTNRVHINQQWLWSGFVRSMKHRGFKLFAYTVNSRDRAEELEQWGVDGIFTDYPSLFHNK